MQNMKSLRNQSQRRIVNINVMQTGQFGIALQLEGFKRQRFITYPIDSKKYNEL